METINRNLEELTAFHFVANEGSFTRAAQALGTSKAMVSKQVSRLETSMNAKLFHRTTRTLSLTEQGAALFSYSQKIFELSSEASRRLRDMGEGSSGVIKISAPVSLGEMIFPSLLRQVQGALPLVKFEIDLSNETRDFSKDKIDFALRAADNHHPDLIARHLGRLQDVICASPSYLSKSKVGDHPNDLLRQNCILHSQVARWNQWTLSSQTEDVKVEVNGSCSTNQYPMARLMCLAGVGIVRIPLYMVEQDLERGQLVRLFPNYDIATHPLYLLYLRNEYATKKHKIVRDLMLKWFGDRKEFFVAGSVSHSL